MGDSFANWNVLQAAIPCFRGNLKDGERRLREWKLVGLRRMRVEASSYRNTAQRFSPCVIMNSAFETLQSNLTPLGLKAAEQRLAPTLDQASQKQPGYADFVDEVLSSHVGRHAVVW